MRFFAGLASILAGLGFGLPCAWGIARFARTGDTWTFLGFPTYGGGPFERVGIETTVSLLLGFLVVCIIEVVLAAMIWNGDPAVLTIGFLVLPVERTRRSISTATSCSPTTSTRWSEAGG